MLYMTVEAGERWDPIRREFMNLDKPLNIAMEHSLISISKWEEKWHIAFLGKEKKTDEQVLDYIRCMVVQPQNVREDFVYFLSKEDQMKINSYISDPATATQLNEQARKLMNRGYKKSNEVLTSELIYYYMAEFRLPAEYQKWRLPRLMMLIEVCNMKEWEKDPKHKKMLANSTGSTNLSKAYYEINRKRCKELNTKG